MKLCILGPSKRTRNEVVLMNIAKRKFDSVLYVPYEQVSISLDHKFMHKNVDIMSFDTFLPRIKKTRSLFGYLFLKAVGKRVPISPEAFLYTSDRFLLFNRLREFFIPTPKMYFFDSVATAKRTVLSSEISYPLALRTSSVDKIMFANSPKEIRAMLDALKTFNAPIYVEEFDEGDYYTVHVVGEECIATLKVKPGEKEDIFFGRGKYSEITIGNEIKEIAVSSIEAIGSGFGVVTVSKRNKNVINVDLVPNVLIPKIKDQEIVAKELIDYFYNFSARSQERGISDFKRFIMDLKSTVKDVFKI